MTAGDQQRSQCIGTVESPPDADSREASAKVPHEMVPATQMIAQAVKDVCVTRMLICESTRHATSGLVDNEENGVLEWPLKQLNVMMASNE